MKFTKNIITREEAVALAPAYVKFIEDKDWDALMKLVIPAFETLKRGQSAVTFSYGVYLRVKVTSLNNHDFRAVDGPIVRVGNDEYTWRVDGDRYAYPI